MARKTAAKKAASAARKPSIPDAHGDYSWFNDARFGMFIHWGLYAMPARHEWVKHVEQISTADYAKYYTRFDPDLYNPKAWAKAAREAGMKYFCITTKHHEGFCLWDSKYTDYKAPNTPCGKDLLRPMVDAFRDEGLHVGFYYSLIDWHHEQFGVDRIHPMRGNADERKKNAKRDVSKYAQYMRDQVRELLTQFGKIDYLFFDFSYPGEDGKGWQDYESDKLLTMVRQLQPHILVNDRLDLLDIPGGWDVKTPEQFMVRKPVTWKGKPVCWETCQTFSGSWGYHRDEQTWKSVDQLLMMLIDTTSKNGNVLLNVGPTARGEFDARAMDRLSGMGAWMQKHSRSIYGCGVAPGGFKAPNGTRLTYNAKTKRLYMHIFDWPIGTMGLDGFAGKVKYAQFLHDASEIRWSTQTHGHVGTDAEKDHKTIYLHLPVIRPNVAVPVVEMYL
ncbi:MAG: alpha-L-fucosidase [Phycisphaerae bacterium]